MPKPFRKELPRAIDRRTASEILGVSLRTIDRYIKNGRLLAEILNGRVWLSRDQVNEMKELKDNPPIPAIFDTEPHANPKATMRPFAAHRSIKTAEIHGLRGIHGTEILMGEELDEGDFGTREPKQHPFKQLYLQTSATLKEKEQRLEAAQYRIGQLESHLAQNRTKHSDGAPPTSNSQQSSEILEHKNEYIEQLKDQVSRERFNRRLLLALVYGILAMQIIIWYAAQT